MYDVKIALSRGPCFGACPVYDLTITGNGEVRYEGQAFVNAMGRRVATISRESVEHLVTRFDEIGFDRLPALYAQMDDASQQTVSFTRGGRTRTVVHDGGDAVPSNLKELQDEIERLTGVDQWIRYDPLRATRRKPFAAPNPSDELLSYPARIDFAVAPDQVKREKVSGDAPMAFKMGIVGLPNVGKSTLFNALTRTAAAQAANFPFCTIEPNIGDVAVPDARLEKLAFIAKSQQVIPARMSFVDIAGLVKGASKGEGLGNQFLANIRECDAIAYVLRCFEDPNIIHVANKVDPLADAEVVETELMLADLESLEKRRTGVEKKAKGGDKESKLTLELIDRSLARLRDGKSARLVERSEDEEKAFRELQLLTSKPALYVCNVDEASAADGNAMTRQVAEYAKGHNAATVIISAEIESQLAQLSEAEQAEFLETLGLHEPGLNRLIREAYGLLGLQTYFTAGPKEARAWTIHKGDRAPQAAGVIHSDFERGFIRAQTIAYDDYITLGGEVPAKEAGKARDEGKEYVVRDGDVMLFKFNT